tara:strand:- start:1487 stop:3070 length:1584 start_codon:yes stop_codon:yes gene_type:complete
MPRLFYSIVVVLLTIATFNTAYSKISFQEMTTTGTGMSLEEAIDNALADAITMVNGKNIYTRTVIKVLGGDSIKDEASRSEELQNFLSLKLAEIKQAIQDSPDDKKKSVDINISKEDMTEKQYSQEYVKDIINEVRGGIKSYEILNKRIDPNGWHHVQLKSQVAKFSIPQQASRTRIAIVPFRFYEEKTASSSIIDTLKSLGSSAQDDKTKILKSSDERFKLSSNDQQRLLRLINQGLTNYLTQTKKFTVLDREYIKEIADEKLNITEGRAPAIEMAKLGNEVSGDYIFVGAVEDFTVKKKITKIQSSGEEFERIQATFYVSYRLLDVATKQVQNANNFKITSMFKTTDPIEIITQLVDKGIKVIGEEILFSVYPVVVEQYSMDRLILGQGGNQFKKGDAYELYEKGEKIIDSYTKEPLGNIENYLGKVEITKVNANFSKAKFVEGQFDMSVGFIPGQYIVRPIKFDEDAFKKEQFKKMKKKIEKARIERQKLMDAKNLQREKDKAERLKKREEKKRKAQSDMDELF